MVITRNGKPNNMPQDLESYNYKNMRNAIGFLKLMSQGKQDAEDEKWKSQEDEKREIHNIRWSQTAERNFFVIVAMVVLLFRQKNSNV